MFSQATHTKLPTVMILTHRLIPLNFITIVYKLFFCWTTVIPIRNLNQWLCNFWGVNKASFRQVDNCGKKNSSVCPGFVSDCKMLAQQILLSSPSKAPIEILPQSNRFLIL